MSRRFRRIAIACFILLLPLAAYSLWDYLELRRLIAEIEAIRAKGEPVSDPRAARVYELLPDDQQRTGDYYVAAAALALHTKPLAATGPVHLWLATTNAGREDLRGTPAPAPEPASPASGATVTREGEARLAGARRTATVRGQMTEQAKALAAPVGLVEGLRAVIDASPEALALADKAAGLPFGGLPPGADYGSRLLGLTTLSRLIGARTLVLSLDGRGDEAVDSAVVALAVRRALSELRWMVPQDDHEISAILSLSTPSAAALRRLDAALAAATPTDRPVEHVLSARAEYLEQMWRRYYGADPALPQFYTLPMRSVGETLVRPLISQRFVRSLQAWAAMIPAARLPASRRIEAMQTIAEARAWLSPELGNIFFRTRVETDTLTIDRCARLAIAIERYRRDHAGTLPASLSELIPQYLPAVPLDPAVDAPLRYRPQADAYTVYGVGRDQKDDSGDLTSQLRPGLRPETAVRALSGRDLGLRVLLH
jgi:hypothetical protein